MKQIESQNYAQETDEGYDAILRLGAFATREQAERMAAMMHDIIAMFLEKEGVFSTKIEVQ